MEDMFKSHDVQKTEQGLESIFLQCRRLSVINTSSKNKEIDEDANLEHVDTILDI